MIDETCSEPEPFTAREWLSGGADLGRFLVMICCKELFNIEVLLLYGIKFHSHKRRTPVEDMDALVALWVEVFAGCLTAHDKADYDQADFKHDEMLDPILAAPVPQLREFGEKLCVALEADARIPYVVWRPFVEMLRPQLKDLSKDKVITLKTELARKIAADVEEGVKPQILDAIAGALRWRSEDTLKKIDKAVATGAQPKLVGRQSCLFLEVAGERVML